MTNAPERIWIDFEPRDWPSERIMYGDMPEPYTAYIRADLMAELVDVLQRAVDEYGQKMRTATDKKEKRDWQSMLIAAVDIQYAALAKIKETTK